MLCSDGDSELLQKHLIVMIHQFLQVQQAQHSTLLLWQTAPTICYLHMFCNSVMRIKSGDNNVTVPSDNPAEELNTSGGRTGNMYFGCIEAASL